MPRLRLPALALLLALPLVGGCAVESINAPAEGSGVVAGGLISASVQVPVAAPGASVSVRFVNAASNLFSVNTCLRRVERMAGGEWVLHPQELRLCDARLDVVPAQAALTTTADVPADAAPGEYRFRFSMAQPTGPAVDIVTPPFRVE
jgi:hypothetical protein